MYINKLLVVLSVIEINNYIIMFLLICKCRRITMHGSIVLWRVISLMIFTDVNIIYLKIHLNRHDIIHVPC